MVRKILIPLDGSPLAERALPVGEALAREGSARILLVQAVLVHSFPGVDATESQVQAIEQAQQYLEEIASWLREQGVEVETAVPYGPAIEAILDEITLRDADLVVMTTHGRSGLGRWLYGSVAESVLARSPVPVLLVQSWQGERPWRKIGSRPNILVPLDGSPFAEEALPVATEFARQFQARLVLLQVVPPAERAVIAAAPGVPVVTEVPESESMVNAAQRYLEEIARRLAPHLGELPRVDVRLGQPVVAIADATRDYDVALVAMSTHGRTGLGRLLFGSVAASVLRQGSAPLLLVRPSALRAGRERAAAEASSGL